MWSNKELFIIAVEMLASKIIYILCAPIIYSRTVQPATAASSLL